MPIVDAINLSFRKFALNIAKKNKEVAGWMAWVDNWYAENPRSMPQTNHTFRNVLAYYALKRRRPKAIKNMDYLSLYFAFTWAVLWKAEDETKKAFVPVLATALAEATKKAHDFGEILCDDDLTEILKIARQAMFGGYLSDQGKAAVRNLIDVSTECILERNEIGPGKYKPALRLASPKT